MKRLIWYIIYIGLIYLNAACVVADITTNDLNAWITTMNGTMCIVLCIQFNNFLRNNI